MDGFVGRAARRTLAAALLSFWMALWTGSAAGQSLEIDREPILYRSTPAADPVARLRERIERGETVLEHREGRGYLDSLLAALEVSPRSQVLVFSKTSFQRERISPAQPRAIYFNDDVYVGWVPGGEMVEVAAMDPRQGAVFYVLNQERRERPSILRQDAECLQCHASTMTRGVPGTLVRSVYPDPRGFPILSAGTFLTTHESPLSERWGGWYVTGTHGSESHLGNRTAVETDSRGPPFRQGRLNLADLSGIVDTGPYLSAHSDIVALMVLEHEAYAHNVLTRAGYEARVALHYQEEMNRLMDRPRDALLESVEGRLDRAAERILECFLFAGEKPLVGPVRGTARFAEEFQARGPRDSRGRSLRDLDLERRLFRYPLSFLILGPQFDALPPALRDRTLERLRRILLTEEEGKLGAALDGASRRAILEILLDTWPGLPEAWRPVRAQRL